MTRTVFALEFPDLSKLKELIISACDNHSHAAFYDSHNNPPDEFHRYRWIAGLGAKEISIPRHNYFQQLFDFHQHHQDWLFGHLCYDLKNHIENLETRHRSLLGFPLMTFFIPETVIYQKEQKIFVESYAFHSGDELLHHLEMAQTKGHYPKIKLEEQTSRKEYLNNVKRLHEQLQFGNIYEINYCIEFAKNVKSFFPTETFMKLNRRSKAPFSAFYKNEKNYLCCASPERYLQKTGTKIISQPMKGTAKRSSDPEEDLEFKQALRDSEKERSENVMITDLVRNDLSRTAAKASVKVPELFGIYSYPTVHQMVTTVESELAAHHNFGELLATTFPMGSMTGAPKVSAMKLIDKHETFARNLFSGSVGYITPSGDFDFNVVIRSLLYNATNGYLSARVGSAITINSDPQQEYEECLLKAQNLFAALKA